MAAFDSTDHGTPSILTVPGLGNSGPDHWQTLWELARPDTARADLGMWEQPRRNPWVTRLDREIRAARAPVVLVAHSLGCLAVAWWAELVGQAWGWPVAGALLVAPPDPEAGPAIAALRDFGPVPRTALPFPALVVGSVNDPYASPQRVADMAHGWGAACESVGALGHINAASGLGDWPQGQRLLAAVIAAAGAAPPPATGAASFVMPAAALADA